MRRQLSVRLPEIVSAPAELPGAIWLPEAATTLPITVPLPIMVCVPPRVNPHCRVFAVTSNVAPLKISMIGVERIDPVEVNDNVPAFMNVLPLYELEPLSASVPEPSLFSPPQPERMPESVIV